MAARKERKLKFILLFLQAHTASRVRCAALMFILCRAAKNEPRKRAKTFPLGTPRHCRATWRVWEKNMKDFYSSPAILPPRAAGRECKNSCCLGRGGACSSRLLINYVEIRRVAGGEIFCFCLSRASSVSVFFFKTPTQNLKMQHFAQT